VARVHARPAGALCSLPESAAYLNIGQSSLYRLLDQGQLAYEEILPGKRQITRTELDRYRESRRVASKPSLSSAGRRRRGRQRREAKGRSGCSSLDSADSK